MASGRTNCSRRNPRLVILRVTGFGQDGPYAMQPGFATIAEALSGFSNLLGEPDGPPLLPPIALTDEVTALVGAFGVMLALRHAERTGEGQMVDVNLLESMFQIMGPLVSAYAHMGYLQPRLGSGIPYTVPRGTYQCADGRWVAISSSSDSVAGARPRSDRLAGDERFGTFPERSANREDLEAAVRAWVAARSAEEVIREFRRVDAAVAPVLDMSDIFRDEHYRARGRSSRDRRHQDAERRRAAVEDAGALRHAGKPAGADSEHPGRADQKAGDPKFTRELSARSDDPSNSVDRGVRRSCGAARPPFHDKRQPSPAAVSASSAAKISLSRVFAGQKY